MTDTGLQDEGASAVEFALVSMLLFTILFGIVQYGFGFYQYQALASATHEAARIAQPGFDTCSGYVAAARSGLDGKGLDDTALDRIQLTYQSDYGSTVDLAQAAGGGVLTVTMTYTPIDLGMPFVPFPDTLTQRTRVPIENLGAYRAPIDWPSGVCP